MKGFEIYADREHFDKQTRDVRLRRLIALSRVLNALYFCHNAYLDYRDKATAQGRRQTFNATFFMAGTLFEGFKLIDSIRCHFEELNSFKSGFGKLLEDEEVTKFRSGDLKTARDKYCFHFDKDTVNKVIDGLDFEEYSFLIQPDNTRTSAYYELADTVAINYLSRHAATNDEGLSLLRDYLIQLATFVQKFQEAGEALIEEVLLELDWSLRDLDS